MGWQRVGHHLATEQQQKLTKKYIHIYHRRPLRFGELGLRAVTRAFPSPLVSDPKLLNR